MFLCGRNQSKRDMEYGTKVFFAWHVGFVSFEKFDGKVISSRMWILVSDGAVRTTFIFGICSFLEKFALLFCSFCRSLSKLIKELT